MLQPTTLLKIAGFTLLFGGYGHALATLPSLFGSGPFTPTAPGVQEAMAQSSVVLIATFGGEGTALMDSLWGAYLGFNISQGLGLGFFGLIILLLVRHDPALFRRMRLLMPVLIGMAALWFVVALSFFFYAPILLTGCALACLIAARRRVGRREEPH